MFPTERCPEPPVSARGGHRECRFWSCQTTCKQRLALCAKTTAGKRASGQGGELDLVLCIYCFAFLCLLLVLAFRLLPTQAVLLFAPCAAYPLSFIIPYRAASFLKLPSIFYCIIFYYILCCCVIFCAVELNSAIWCFILLCHLILLYDVIQ